MSSPDLSHSQTEIGATSGAANVDPRLTGAEARVLGCLIEKSITTPDLYPMSLNALRLACNQTTNRDPVVSFDDTSIELALASLRDRQLARRLKNPGERVVKHRHVAAETLGLDPAQIAIVCVLLLRGAQTPGELKQRTDRMHDFGSLDALEATLGSLTEGGFVSRVERRPGQKEARWRELLSEPNALEDHVRAPTGTSNESATDSVSTESDHEAPEPARLDVIDPRTATLIRSLATDSDHEVDAKVARARAAQREWCARAHDDRAGPVLEAFERIGDNIDELGALAARETGGDARWFIRRFAAITDDGFAWACGDVEPARGVVALITSAADPHAPLLEIGLRALLGGSTVVVKPSARATLSALAIVDRLHECGVPVDVAQCIVGGSAAGAALVRSGVDIVHFRGGHEAGARVARLAGERAIPADLVLRGAPATD